MASFYCAPETIRTSDTRFRRAVLYPLSYEGITKASLAAADIVASPALRRVTPS